MSTTRRLFLLAALATSLAHAAGPAYFPPRGDWQRAEPAAVGMDAARLAEAVAGVPGAGTVLLREPSGVPAAAAVGAPA